MARPFINPMPHVDQARDAATRVFTLQRDLMMLNTELKTLRQLKRLAYGIAALVTLDLALVLFLFWATFALHEAGWSSWALAFGSLIVFGVLTAVLVRIAIQVGKEKRNGRVDTSHLGRKAS